MESHPSPEGELPARRARPTISQVATLAGVSIKTVSRVINLEPNVKESTAAKVRETIAALDYHASEQASALRRSDGRTKTLGLLVGSVANPFTGALHRALEEVMTQHGIAVFASSLDDDPVREKAAVAAFLRRRVDGLVLTTIAKSQGYLVIEQERGTPMVFVDREPVGLEADVVISDNAAGASRGTNHLLSHGHRNIAYIGDRLEIQTAQERRRGFMEAMGSHGIPTSEITSIDGVHDIASAQAVVSALMAGPNPPTAIFSGQNLITIGALYALKEVGRSSDTALVGFDDIQLADLLEPGLTVIAQDPAQIGEAAAERVLARIEGDRTPPQRIVVPTRLIVRSSGEIPPRE
jgi:DNA-binding LacI/PurR family transcriptional regulator